MEPQRFSIQNHSAIAPISVMVRAVRLMPNALAKRIKVTPMPTFRRAEDLDLPVALFASRLLLPGCAYLSCFN